MPIPPKTHQACRIEVGWMLWGLAPDLHTSLVEAIPPGCSAPLLTLEWLRFRLADAWDDIDTIAAPLQYPPHFPFPHPAQLARPFTASGASLVSHDLCRVEVGGLIDTMTPIVGEAVRRLDIEGGCDPEAFWNDSAVLVLFVAALNGWWNNPIAPLPPGSPAVHESSLLSPLPVS